VSVGLAVCGCAYAFCLHASSIATGILFGGAFGIVNTMLLARFVMAIANTDPKDPLEIAVTFLVKFPIVFGLLILVLWRHWVDPVGFLIGFPMILVGALVAAIFHYYIGEGRRVTEKH